MFSLEHGASSNTRSTNPTSDVLSASCCHVDNFCAHRKLLDYELSDACDHVKHHCKIMTLPPNNLSIIDFSSRRSTCIINTIIWLNTVPAPINGGGINKIAALASLDEMTPRIPWHSLPNLALAPNSVCDLAAWLEVNLATDHENDLENTHQTMPNHLFLPSKLPRVRIKHDASSYLNRAIIGTFFEYFDLFCLFLWRLWSSSLALSQAELSQSFCNCGYLSKLLA